MKLLRLWFFWLLLPLGLAACAGSASDQSVAQLTVALELAPIAGVHAVHFAVQPTACDSGEALGPAVEREAALLDFALPELPGLQPTLDPGAHLFSDALIVLDPGCYSVTATPLDDSGNPSSACYAARKDNVVVSADSTTEILLISQCAGRELGGLDSVSVLNRPPTLENVEFAESQFVECGSAQELCATASDEDHDALLFEWQEASNNPDSGGLEVIEHTVTEAGTTECVRITPQEGGEFSLELSVFDLGLFNGVPLKIEEILAMQAEPMPSRADLDIAFFATECAPPPSPLVATLRTLAQFPQGYCVDVTVLNTGSATVTAWTVELELRHSRLDGFNAWGAIFAESPGSVVATPVSYNRTLAPGASALFGFCASALGADPGARVRRVF